MAEAVVVVAGAGGFIGGHLTASLLRERNVRVRAVDVKPQAEWFQVHPNAQNLTLDLRLREHCFKAVEGATEVYNLAADMGGMGFIENNKALCMLSVLINTHLLLAAKELGAKRFFFASSACVYAASKQNHTRLEDGLRETDAYPAMPEDGYGWEKAVQRTHVPALSGRFRRRGAYRPLPQRLRAARHVGRRPRKSTRGDVPESHSSETGRIA